MWQGNPPRTRTHYREAPLVGPDGAWAGGTGLDRNDLQKGGNYPVQQTIHCTCTETDNAGVEIMSAVTHTITSRGQYIICLVEYMRHGTLCVCVCVLY